jgi:tetratricopeptide (TPR) repeat protein
MRFRPWLFVIALSFLVLRPAWAEVRVWEGTLTLPTYEEGLPNPNPPFDQFSSPRFNYPYALRDNLTDRRVDHLWRAVYIENEYLKCSVLPDIGGHLYTCIDKISGQPMFYANPSIKKAKIGIRGAWAAFGIEFNFPVSHNWVSMSPVPFAYGSNPDGSAYITVGNIDRPYGMEWRVELVLRPGTTVLEEHVTLNNRSDTRHRFYWWNNAAVEVKDDSRICYPMRFTASHGYTEVETWPVDSKGTDLSVLRNQTRGPVSVFAHGTREPFMAVWRPDTRTGTVHYADHAQVPGEKIWSWGVDADGLDWRRALSDNNSAYVEVQAGLFRNQETYAFLDPRQTIQFTEYWMPARDIGGVARANPDGVLNLSRRNTTLVAGLNANRRIPNASLRILDGNRVLAEEVADLSPERTWSKEVAVPDAGRKYTFELRDASGAVLLRQTEGEYDWTPAADIRTGPQPADREPAPEARSDGDWLEAGKSQELKGELLRALDTYKSGLAKYPDSFALTMAAGRLAVSLLRYSEAVGYLEPAAARATWDPEVAYYLGLAYDGLGEERKARVAYEAASPMPAFHAAASLRLAEQMARQGHLAEAFDLLRPLTSDLRVAEETAAIRHALGRPAEKTARFSAFLAFDLAESGHEDPALIRSLAADPERVLEIAAEYMRLGLYRRALGVLSREYPAVPPDETEPGAVLPQHYPLVAYYRGYCHQKLGESASADYSLAEKLPTRFVFPVRAESLDVLVAAVHANPQDATAQYLLGTLDFSRGMSDDALAAWQEARRLNPKLPALHAAIGRTLLQIKDRPAEAVAAFREGIAVDPLNLELYIGMDQALSVMGSAAVERVRAIESYPDQAAMPAELVYELALNRAAAGDYQHALTLFQNRYFPREEGGTNVRQVWVEVNTQYALSLVAAGKCEAALPLIEHLAASVSGLDFTRDGVEPFVQSARTQYLLGMADSQCHRAEQARDRFRAPARSTDPAQIVWARRAARELPGYDDAQWRARLESALVYANDHTETGAHTGFWMYTAGLLEQALSANDSAESCFKRALRMPDNDLSYHLSRLELAQRDEKTTGRN